MEWPAGGRGWLVVFPSTCIASHQPSSQWFFNDFRILLSLSFLLGFCAGYKDFPHAFLLLITFCSSKFDSNQHPSVVIEQLFSKFLFKSLSVHWLLCLFSRWWWTMWSGNVVQLSRKQKVVYWKSTVASSSTFSDTFIAENWDDCHSGSMPK